VDQASNLLLVSSVILPETTKGLKKGEMQMSIIDVATLGMSISTRQETATMSFVAWIVLGLIAGFIGSKLVNKTGEGIVRDVLLGVVGAIIGGYLFNLFGASGVTGLNLYSLLVAVVGAVVFLIVYHAIFRRRRFAM
jgi:uncharacterized membrane protein YeaQ/YmgE (transglycosylase-associated protein family)